VLWCVEAISGRRDDVDDGTARYLGAVGNMRLPMVDVRVVVFVRPMAVELSRYVVEKGRREMDKAEPQKSRDMTGG
jgi:hypothetical protein